MFFNITLFKRNPSCRGSRITSLLLLLVSPWGGNLCCKDVAIDVSSTGSVGGGTDHNYDVDDVDCVGAGMMEAH